VHGLFSSASSFFVLFGVIALASFSSTFDPH